MKIAVITGASSGMGREFVYALDRQQKFDEIWVIARRVERLEALRPRLRAGLQIEIKMNAQEARDDEKM